MILDGQKNLGVTRCEATLFEMILNLRIKLQETHRVGHGRTTFSDAFANFFLSEAKFLGKALVGCGLLDGIQSLALEILDQCELQHLLVRSFADDNGCFRQADLERGPHPAFSGDQLIFTTGDADDERLDDTSFADGFDEVAKLVIAELGSWLQGAGNNLVESDLLNALPILLRGGGGGNPGVDKGSESFAQAFAKPFARCFTG